MKNKFKSKKAALEMSVGTMVTLVLLMVFLVLGIFFIQKVSKLGTNAVDTIDSQVQSEIQKLFTDEGRKMAFYPTSRDVVVKKGDDPKGFAFSVRNKDTEEVTFAFSTTATDVSKCGSTFTEEDANDMLLGGTGTLTVSQGDISEITIVKFVLPESVPPCTIGYKLKVTEGSVTYNELNFFLIIKS